MQYLVVILCIKPNSYFYFYLYSTGIQVVKDCDRLIKSKSHESELTNRINPGNANAVTVKDIPISPTTTQANR